MANSRDDNIRAIAEALAESSDAFGSQVVKGTRNQIDLPSYFDFSEERYRYIENGSRIRDPDANSTRFVDGDEQFLISPEAGDTIQLKTAEEPRYIVGNDVDVSWSFQFNAPLQDASDTFRLFLAEAFEIVYDGSGAVEFRTIEDGAVQASETVSRPQSLDTPTRPQLEFNWYAVGRAELTIEYTDDGTQKTSEPATITVDDDWLSDTPAGRFGFELDVSNPGIELEAGSMAYILQTDTVPSSRPKPHIFSSEELNQVPADGYGVVGALRVDPDRPQVFVNVTSVEVVSEESVDVELTLKAVPPSDTDADFLDPDGDGTDEGPAYPRQNSPQNSVVQWTPNVSTFPTRTYAVDGTETPNGRNAGAAAEASSGRGSGVTRTGQSFKRKRPIYEDDVVLMIGHVPDESTATDLNVFVETDQQW